MQRDFDISICSALRAEQMAQNSKNRRAIFTILRHLRREKRGANGDSEVTLH